MPGQPNHPAPPDGDYAIHPGLGIPKQVAWALGAGVLGIVVGGALLGFGAAVAVPAIRERLRKRPAAQAKDPEPPAGG
jgi:hypothetical protein